MYGQEYMEALEQRAAEDDLLRSVRACKDSVPRERLAFILSRHAQLAAKGLHTGDSDHLGSPVK